ncbi:protein EMSY-LIKE 1-like isoform X2 [Zingiber officinale]|nr:protein EMSY-LIKE 1-like isoform X2 [Zingiber officinale]XP_042452547.1 protein EMSY-LIKE 1-like isoform X2 [Zingiber officinale]XP_042452548.1 protein EMSY-LIKE 1-like isoform X2 [Zingiber officinale]
MMTGYKRNVVGAMPYSRMQNDMEIQIHQLEQAAYNSILRAFKAQSDALTWEKESLITDLRKELRVSGEEHRELLSRVNVDDIIQRIREWRREGGLQSGLFNNIQLDGPTPSPSISASHKRQRTQAAPSLSFDAPSPGLHLQPSSSAAKRRTAIGAKGKKPKTVSIRSIKFTRCHSSDIMQFIMHSNSRVEVTSTIQSQAIPSAASTKTMQYPSAGPSGRGQVPACKNSSGAPAVNEAAKKIPCDPLIGRKVMTRWPEDNNFYEAVIMEYNPVAGLHGLIYDVGTGKETYEWVNLKEILPEDIRWEGGDPGISHRSGQSIKKPSGRTRAAPGAGRGRITRKKQAKKDFPPFQNGINKKSLDHLEIFNTEMLIREVEKVFVANHPDPVAMEKAKALLKEHEQSLIDAIARLAGASDGESGN